ncbi:hypothetical protein B296_00030175 [Ensete ventricosum]|uniref:Uncharacterized protein n=1 Tax=Ensete ventricosum TaxID=4639 RepID=A0A427AJD0_ENSVE|nr:hypothetical protein B296_00030175 [Ensete ventricosum]
MAENAVPPVKTEEKRSWADEEKEAAAPPSQAADEAQPSELKKIESLSISDGKDSGECLLDDPDDSEIKAVRLRIIVFDIV